MNYTPNSKAEALVLRLSEARENIEAIRELWIALFGEPTPDNSQIHRWLIRYGFDIAVESIQDLATWVGKHKQALAIIEAERVPTTEELKEHTKTLLDLIRYASGIMANKLRSKADGDERSA
jgi:hypothetical protein